MASGIYNPYNYQDYQQNSEYQTAQQTDPPYPTHGQTEARFRSVNTDRNQASSSSRELPSPAIAAGYPAQRIQTQPSARPPQVQYGHGSTTTVSSARSTATAAAAQYNDYNRRQLPSVDRSRDPQNPATPTPYSYAANHTVAPITQASALSNVAEQYHQGTITVDPMAVYDPWPEYQRQQEEMLAQRAVENASGEEEKRKAEAAHLEEERRREGLRKKAEEAERARQTALLNVKQTQPSTKAQAQPTTDDIGSASGGLSGEASLEAEIRAMMSKMRELNNKDPKLLARIWEEERRVKTPSSPTAQAKLTPQSSTVQTGPSSALVVANQRKKAVPKESPAAADLAMSQTTAPVAVPNSAMRPQSQAIATGAVRPTGNTMWPPERREQLAAAAAAYLNGQNPNNPVTADRILSMLEGNPSYIELCGHLEVMSLKLDRGAFAKSLLTAVPDANSGSRSQLQVQNRPSGQIAAPQTSGSAGQRTSASPATMTKRNSNPPHIAPTQFHTPITQSPLSRLAHPQLHNNNVSAPHSLVPTAEFLPTNPKSKSPANKEEAARKRNFNEIIDLTAADEEDDMEPMHKRPNLGSTFSAQSPAPTFANAMDVDEGICRVDNVTTAVSVSSQPLQIQGPSLSAPLPPHDNLRMQTVVKPLDKSIALRRSCYNIKTIARDVLLACGRHPQERQLNAHLDILKTSLGSYVSIDSDLSTLRWDLIDPGIPPRGFYRDAVQSVAEDADDEDESEGEGGRSGRPPPPTSHAIGVGGAKAQALHPSNPFKQKRRGRPPQHPYPDNMDASAPRSKAAAEGVGYAAFRSATAYDAEGKPLPKKKGRPVGWRKAIHGSAAVQANKHNNPQPDSVQSVPTQYRQLRNVDTNENQPSKVASRSPHEGNMAMRYQSFNCKWQNCKAELHNLETLKKHVHKRHRKETEKGSLECLWGDCGREVTHVDPITSTRIEFHSPFTFTEDSEWRNHLELRHFVPLSWELGDGPATGLSDANESEAYLSDAYGRQVTPRITAEPSHYGVASSASMRGRGRAPKIPRDQEGRDMQARLVSQKKRLGGPGIDRGGATLANEKRRKGFSDDDQADELVDTEG